MSGRGLSCLSLVLDSRMASHAVPAVVLDYGTIQSDMGLKCDNFGPSIPKGSYELCRHLTLPNPMATTTDGSTVPRPAQLSPIQPGDRVLVGWLNAETVPVIIDVVVSS